MSESTDRIDKAESLLSELEQIESHLSTLQRGLTRSHRLATLGTLAAIVAHEFNNLLTPIISYSQLAKRYPDDIELLRKAADKTLRNAERAAKICSSMLDFSRDSNEAVDADVAKVVDEVFICMAREPRKDGIELELDMEADVHVAIGPLGLQQVLLNLALNALDAMPRGGRLEFVLRVENHDGGPEQVIDVRDSGPGVPPEKAERIFDPFYTTKEDGTGLGLSISERIVEEHGGFIEVAPAADGACFCIHLPAGK